MIIFQLLKKKYHYDKIIIQDHIGLGYQISNENHYAVINQYHGTSKNLIIPRSIKHESSEYLVVGINDSSFKNSKITIFIY